MRVFVQFHTGGDDGSLSAQLSGAAGSGGRSGVYFCSLADGGEASLQALQMLLDHTARTKRVQLPSSIASACIVVKRKGEEEQEDDSAAAGTEEECFRVDDARDVREVRANDHLHVLFNVAAPTQTAITALRLLQVTFATRPRSQAEKLLAALDDIDPVCRVERAADEHLFALEEVAQHAALPWASEARVAFASKLRSACSTHGFARLRFTHEQMRTLRELFAAQRTFFSLPREEKMQSAPFANRASSYQIPFGYSRKDECRKEFFVVRQASTAQSDSHIDFSLPSNPANFAASAMAALHLLGGVCQQLMTLLLQSLRIPQAKVEALLAGTMQPPQQLHQLGYTSVIELFRYSGYPSPAPAAVSSFFSSSSPALASAPARSPPPPPPLPCSIHSDASLLTLIPRCLGPAGLQVWNTRASDWQAVEAQSREDEGIVFLGDMFARVTNSAIMPTQHRVVFQPDVVAAAAVSAAATTAAAAHGDRYSCPFELFLAPSTVVDCAHLLADSGDLLPLHAENESVLTAQDALAELSRSRISVNMTHRA